MSPRPKKKRRCGCTFYVSAFKPIGIRMSDLEHIKIYRDELEVLKLCDMEGLIQGEAGEKMGVSRGTVQRILASARQKTAQALATGAALVFVSDDESIE